MTVTTDLEQRIDLTAVAAALNAGGIRAEVEHTGGNVATLFAGATYTDAAGETRNCVAAGPGWFDADGHAWAWVVDFCVGADDDGATDPAYVTTAGTAALARLIAYHAADC